MQSKGSKDLDASVLLMPLMRFISPVDPMWASTMKAVESRLVEDTLVRRYEVEKTHVDGLPGPEGSFTACSFWYIECLARAGQLEKAQLLFEKLLGYANHLGLYAEELGPDGRHLGNFPQAFTHLALIKRATYLDRALSGKDNEVWRLGFLQNGLEWTNRLGAFLFAGGEISVLNEFISRFVTIFNGQRKKRNERSQQVLG